MLAHAGLLAVWDLAARPLLALGLVALATAAMVWAVRRLREAGVAVGASIVLVAAVLRLLLVSIPPTLSDDLLRYVWDGRVSAAGLDPYRLAPSDPSLEALRDELWESLPHRDVPTVYPPLAMAAFSISARLPASAASLKALLAVCDVATCLLLVALARRLGMPESRAIWYAWNPLAVVETAGMGHVDALGVLAVVATVYLLLAAPRRVHAAAATAAAAVLAKLVPLLALPAWARHSARPTRFAAVVLALVAVALAPIAVRGVPPGLVTYGVSWEFNGPLYEPLWRLLDRVDASGAIAGGLDALKARSGYHELWNRFYPFNYPQLLAKALLLPGLLLFLVLAWRRREPAAATGAVFAALVLFSSTVYPWYVLWVLPWAALCRHRAWLLLAWTVSFSYLPQHAPVELVPWVYLAIWIPFFAVLLSRPRWSTA